MTLKQLKTCVTYHMTLKQLKTCVTYHMIFKQLKTCVTYHMIFKRQKRCVMSYGFIVRMRQATCIEMQMIDTVWCRTTKQAKASCRTFFFFFGQINLIRIMQIAWPFLTFSSVAEKTGCCREVICQLGTLYGGRCPCGEVAVFKVVVLVRKFTRLMWEIKCL